MPKYFAIAILACSFELLASSVKPLGKNFIRIDKEKLRDVTLVDLEFTQDHRLDKRYVFGYMSDRILQELKESSPAAVTILDPKLDSLGFDYETLEISEKYIGSHLAEQYHDYDKLSQSLKAIAQANPNLIKLKTAGKSVAGRELWYVEMSNYAEGSLSERPKVLYIANMHGNETAGRELMLRLIKYLAEEYENNPRIQNILNQTQIFIMPSMNPDGFENQRRGNQDNYDLNRSFPDFTLQEADDPAGRPLENQAIMKLHREHHFVLALNFHGGAVCFNMPWDTQSNATNETRFAEDLLMRTLARVYADLNQTMRNTGFDQGVTYGYEWYHVDGSMQDWASYFRQSIHATIELSTDKWPPASELDGIWQENKESLLRYIEAASFGYFLKVQDDQGRPIQSVKMKHEGADKFLNYPGGTVLRPALEGVYKVQVKAAGFESVSFDGEAKSLDEGLQIVRLERRL